jgi:hypothetical protein
MLDDTPFAALMNTTTFKSLPPLPFSEHDADNDDDDGGNAFGAEYEDDNQYFNDEQRRHDAATLGKRGRHGRNAVARSGQQSDAIVRLLVGTTLAVSGNTTLSSNLVVGGNVSVGTANLFVDTVSSNVGVGTNLPLAKLDVKPVQPSP